MSSANMCLGNLGIGIYHSGVEIEGLFEYWFGSHHKSISGIYCSNPKQQTLGPFRKSIYMGDTRKTLIEIEDAVNDLKIEYLGCTYDIFRKNCHSFSQDFIKILLDKEIPKFVNRIARFSNNFRCLFPVKFLKGPRETYEDSFPDSMRHARKNWIKKQNFRKNQNNYQKYQNQIQQLKLLRNPSDFDEKCEDFKGQKSQKYLEKEIILDENNNQFTQNQKGENNFLSEKSVFEINLSQELQEQKQIEKFSITNNQQVKEFDIINGRIQRQQNQLYYNLDYELKDEFQQENRLDDKQKIQEPKKKIQNKPLNQDHLNYQIKSESQLCELREFQKAKLKQKTLSNKFDNFDKNFQQGQINQNSEKIEQNKVVNQVKQRVLRKKKGYFLKNSQDQNLENQNSYYNNSDSVINEVTQTDYQDIRNLKQKENQFLNKDKLMFYQQLQKFQQKGKLAISEDGDKSPVYQNFQGFQNLDSLERNKSQDFQNYLKQDQNQSQFLHLTIQRQKNYNRNSNNISNLNNSFSYFEQIGSYNNSNKSRESQCLNCNKESLYQNVGSVKSSCKKILESKRQKNNSLHIQENDGENEQKKISSFLDLNNDDRFIEHKNQGKNGIFYSQTYNIQWKLNEHKQHQIQIQKQKQQEVYSQSSEIEDSQTENDKNRNINTNSVQENLNQIFIQKQNGYQQKSKLDEIVDQQQQIKLNNDIYDIENINIIELESFSSLDGDIQAENQQQQKQKEQSEVIQQEQKQFSQDLDKIQKKDQKRSSILINKLKIFQIDDLDNGEIEEESENQNKNNNISTENQEKNSSQKQSYNFQNFSTKGTHQQLLSQNVSQIQSENYNFSSGNNNNSNINYNQNNQNNSKSVIQNIQNFNLNVENLYNQKNFDGQNISNFNSYGSQSQKVIIWQRGETETEQEDSEQEKELEKGQKLQIQEVIQQNNNYLQKKIGKNEGNNMEIKKSQNDSENEISIQEFKTDLSKNQFNSIESGVEANFKE